VAGVVVGNWKPSGEDSFVKVVDHMTARSAPPKILPAPPKLLSPSPMIASISYVILCRLLELDMMHACRVVDVQRVDSKN